MNTLAILGIESPAEILLILLVVLLLFGGKKLPELARALGKSISEFKRGQYEGQQTNKEIEKTNTPPSSDTQGSKSEQNCGCDKK